MKQNRLNLYLIDMKYVRNLAKADDHVMSVSPQTGKETRPFVGVVVICGKEKYCIPLSSPKPKHSSMKNDVDFTRIMDGERLIGVLNYLLVQSEKAGSFLKKRCCDFKKLEKVRQKWTEAQHG